MPRFIAVHTMPITEAGLKDLTKAKAAKGVSWTLSYVDFADNKVFCVWEAPDKEAVEKELKEKKVPFDAVYPVQVFNVRKAKLEK